MGTRCSLKMSKNINKRATENSILKFLTVSSVSSDSIVKGIIDDIIKTTEKSTSKKRNIYNILLINMTQSCQIKQRYTFRILRLLNNTCVKHNFKSVHVSNLFWSREYNCAKEICKYPSFSKVRGNYPLDLKIIWSSGVMPLNYIKIDKIQVKDDFEVSDLYCIRVMLLYYAYGHNIVIFSNKWYINISTECLHVTQSLFFKMWYYE